MTVLLFLLLVGYWAVFVAYHIANPKEEIAEWSLRLLYIFFACFAVSFLANVLCWIEKVLR